MVEKTPTPYQVGSACFIEFPTSGARRRVFDVHKAIVKVDPGCFTPHAFFYKKEDAEFYVAAANCHDDFVKFAEQVMRDHRAQLPSETKDLYGGGCGCPQCERALGILRRANP